MYSSPLHTYLNCPNTIQEVHFLGLLIIFKGDVVHRVNSFLRWVCIEPHLFILGKIDYLFELYTHKPTLTYISVTFTLSYTWVGYSQTHSHLIFELPSKLCPLKCIYVGYSQTHSLVLFDPSQLYSSS